MIPASYFYKDAYLRSWGDPRNMEAEVVNESRHPGPGRRAGVAALLAGLGPFRAGRPHHYRSA